MSVHILVVDDDRSMVKTLCDILRLRGWEADGVYSGEEAVVAVNRGLYDTVLMDLKMPGIDGLAAFRQMRERTPGVRVILMTAHTESTVIKEAEHAGALCVLPKPLDMPSLMNLLVPPEGGTQEQL